MFFCSFRKCWFIWTDLDSFLLFWGNEVLTEIGGVLEFYGKENAVRRQWEREEKEEKKENLEGKQRNSKNRTALDTQKEETMDWNTAFAVLRKFYEEKWDYLNGCPRNEKAWDEEGELQCKIYVSKKRGLASGFNRFPFHFYPQITLTASLTFLSSIVSYSFSTSIL